MIVPPSALLRMPEPSQGGEETRQDVEFESLLTVVAGLPPSGVQGVERPLPLPIVAASIREVANSAADKEGGDRQDGIEHRYTLRRPHNVPVSSVFRSARQPCC